MEDINLLPTEEKKAEEKKKKVEKSKIEMTAPIIEESKKEEAPFTSFDFLKRLWDKLKIQLKLKVSEESKTELKKPPKPKKPKPAMIIEEKFSPKEFWLKRFFLFFTKKSSFLRPKEEAKEKIPSLEASVNLLPAEIAVFGKVKKQKIILSGVFIASFLLVIFLYLGLTIYCSKTEIKIRNTEIVISELNREIKEYEEREKEPQGLREKINIIGNLLEKRVYWTKFFALLEKYTIPEVTYLGFSAGQMEKITLRAMAKDYTSLARQFVVLKKARDFVRAVDITSANLEEREERQVVNFNINLTLQPEVFRGIRD